jgi:hypothetical protein
MNIHSVFFKKKAALPDRGAAIKTKEKAFSVYVCPLPFAGIIRIRS